MIQLTLVGHGFWKHGETVAFLPKLWQCAGPAGQHNLGSMNVDRILEGLNDQGVDYILIGGMNFLIHHLPELTFDVDVWVRDTPANLDCLNEGLRRLGAEWGPTEQQWSRVPEDSAWLTRQEVFCLTTHHGALDVFRSVLGLEGRYAECRARASHSATADGIRFLGLSDQDMLACQLALPVSEQKTKRVSHLQQVIRQRAQS